MTALPSGGRPSQRSLGSANSARSCSRLPLSQATSDNATHPRWRGFRVVSAPPMRTPRTRDTGWYPARSSSATLACGVNWRCPASSESVGDGPCVDSALAGDVGQGQSGRGELSRVSEDLVVPRSRFVGAGDTVAVEVAGHGGAVDAELDGELADGRAGAAMRLSMSVGERRRWAGFDNRP